MISLHPTEITIDGRRFRLVPIEDEALPENAAVLTMRAIGRDLRAARSEAGFTQVQLAKKLGVTQSFIAQAELGSTRVGEKYINSVLKVCGLPKDWKSRRGKAR